MQRNCVLQKFVCKIGVCTVLAISMGSCSFNSLSTKSVKTNSSSTVSRSVSVAEGTYTNGSVTITKAQGWLESAYLTWTPESSADSYNVYYKKASSSTWIQIDSMLIRSYGDYYRADIPGLSSGSYNLKLTYVEDSSEQGTASTATVTVLDQDRTGFAFMGDKIPGGYNSDGTVKDDANILYITDDNKDSVELEVGGTTYTGLQNILTGYKKGKESAPLIVRLIGNISIPDTTNKGDIVVDLNKKTVCDGITIEGVGNDAVANGWGLRIKNAYYVEVRNIGFMNCSSDEGDDVGLQQGNYYIWVHNCDMFYGDAGSDADQVKGDGALDCKKSTYITFDYNHFWDNGKCNLLGLSEDTTEGLYITYHHNWYDHSDSRHPRVRFYSAHVYNNYYDGNAKYGAGATEGSSVFMESNYFRNCKYPMLISMQGSDVYDSDSDENDYDDMPTFSSEDGGIIKAYNNYMTGQKRFVAYGDTDYDSCGGGSTVDFDAYVVTDRDDTVPSSVESAYGSNTYNNFDTDSDVMYDYTADSPSDAVANVETFAGRIEGGDFTFTFDNDEDDESSAVNTELKEELTSYETSLVSVQDGSSTTTNDESSDTTDTDDDSSTTDTDDDTTTSFSYIQNFTESGLDSDFFSITGNLSTSKGSVTYDDLTLTTALKMESSTSIEFTTTAESTLTLVFGGKTSASGKTVIIDDTSYDIDSDSTLTVTLESGSHTITKGDSVNLFYISVVSVSTSDSDSTDESSDATDTDDDTTTSFSYIQNFTESGLDSDFFSITGNLSTSKGSVTYDDLTLTTALKMESSTSIEFTTTAESTLTLVFGGKTSASGKTVIIDDTSYDIDSDSTLTVTLESGSHTITKGNSVNLFYISVVSAD